MGQRRAFIGSFTAAGGPGVLVAAVDDDSGALTALGAADDVPDPSYLALAADGNTLYAVSETAAGAVAAYSVTGDKPELAGPPVPVGGSGPTHVGLFAGHVLTANYGSGSVTTVPVRADGTLATAASHVFQHTGSGPHPARQRVPHAHQVQPDPSGRWVVCVDLGTDSVRVAALRDGGLVAHRETALRPGCGPRHLAFHPAGSYAYVLNELAPTVTVCRWDAAEGFLTPCARRRYCRALRTLTPTRRASSRRPTAASCGPRRAARTSCPCSPSTTPEPPCGWWPRCRAAATGPVRSPPRTDSCTSRTSAPGT